MKSSTVIPKKQLPAEVQMTKGKLTNKTTENTKVAFGKLYKGRPRPKITTSWAEKLAKKPVWNNRNQVAHKEL